MQSIVGLELGKSREMRDTGWILVFAHNKENAILINPDLQYDLGFSRHFCHIFAIPTQQREQTSDLTFHGNKRGWTDDEYDRDVEPNLRI